MTISGKCYCGALAYEADGDVLMRVQCHCRECRHVSGGGANYMVGLAEDSFRYVKGQPATYKRADLKEPVTREFCGACGSPILSRTSRAPGAVLVKVGTLDDESHFQRPDAAIYMDEAQEYHLVLDGVPTFEKAPV